MSNSWPADKIERMPIENILPYARNARTHTDEQVAQLAASIREWGWTMPVLVDETGNLIAGHGRVLAARQLGLAMIPTMRARGWSDAQIRAYRLADNQLAQRAGWDDELLHLELSDLQRADYNLDLIGFGERELAELLTERTDGLTDPDDVPPLPEEPVSRTGDLWMLGRHRLWCGDCLEILPTLSGIDGFVLDPPYSSGGQFRGDRSLAPSTKYVQGNSKKTYRNEFGGDNRDQRGFLAWSSMWLGHMYRSSMSGSVICVFTDWRQLPVMSDAIQAGGWVWRNIVTWWKPGIRMQRGRFSSSAEYLLYASHDMPRGGEHSPQNVLSYAPVEGSEKQHIAEKPAALIQEILGVLPIGAIVCDPFVGSGTTIIAAEMTGRICHAIEISPQYVDVAVKRWQNFTGQQAVRESDGATFDAMLHVKPHE